MYKKREVQCRCKHWNSFQRRFKMETFSASVLVVCCFFLLAGAQPPPPPPNEPTTTTCPCSCCSTTIRTTGSTTRTTSTTSIKPPPPYFCSSNPSQTYCNIRTCAPNPSQNTLCQYSPSSWGMNCPRSIFPSGSIISASDKALILDQHNTYRRQVATHQGLAINQPSASNMRQLYWDDELACMATAWVHQCVYANDQCRDVTRFKVGQNIFIATSSSSVTLANSNWVSAITNWYNEINNYNYVVPFPDPTTIPNAIRYTQLAWANTYLVGCATAYYQTSDFELPFQNSTSNQRNIRPDPNPNPGPWPPLQKTYNRLYVCNYGPSGNIMGSPMYSMGTAGSACPTGTTNINGLCACPSGTVLNMNGVCV